MRKPMKALLYLVGTLLVLCALIIAFLFGYRMGQNVLSLSLIVSAVINILTSLFGAGYIFIGEWHDKKHVLLKLYLILSALDTVALFIFEETVGHIPLVVCHALALIGYCILAFVPRLGKKRSELVALCVTLLHIAVFVMEVAFADSFGLTGLEDVTFLVIDVSLDLLIFNRYKIEKE